MWPGTRIPGLYVFGIRWQQQPMCSSGPLKASFAMFSSNVHNHFGEPGVRSLLDLQFVVRDRLHFVGEHVPRRVVHFAASSCGQTAVGYVYVERTEQQVIHLEPREQFLEPIEQE